MTWLKGELLPYWIDKFGMITNISQFDNIDLGDYSSYNKAFKKFFGVNPTQYRKARNDKQ